jgi:carbon storage regulator
MLVLSRKSCESIIVGDHGGSTRQFLKVTVIEIRGDKVKLGFEAAGDIRVHRWEVWKDLHATIHSKPKRAVLKPLVA